jgi:hypothetical protein
MAAMSLESMGRHLRELEALKLYEGTKEERGGLRKKVAELEALLVSKDDLIAQSSEAREALVAKLDETEKALDARGLDLEEKRKEALELTSKVESLEARAKELEGLKATVDGKTLEEVKDEFLKAKAEEIGIEAAKKFQEMKADWERSEKPKEVLDAAVDRLNRIVDVPPEQWASSVFGPIGTSPYSKLVVKVVEILKSGVKRGLDEEFDRRVEEKSDSVAQEKLTNLMNVAWPNWFKTNVDPKAVKLEQRITENVFRVLRGPWPLRCDRCGTDQLTTLMDDDIENLLKEGTIRVQCANPQCVNATLFRLKLTLAGAIRSELSRNAPSSP